MKLTLDTNCIYALENQEPSATALRNLLMLQKSDTIDIALVGISGSERQKGSIYLRDFSEFQKRIKVEGLAELELLKPMGYYDITYWDWCIFASPDQIKLEEKLHNVLFPALPFQWADYCSELGTNPDNLDGPEHRKWRNAKCDVQAVWAHTYAKRNVFVTNDRNFHRKTQSLEKLGTGRNLSPEDALLLVEAIL